MDWMKTIQKGGMGFFTSLISAGAGIVIANPSIITNLIPAKWGQMTLSALVGFVLVAGANWWKNKSVHAGDPQK